MLCTPFAVVVAEDELVDWFEWFDEADELWLFAVVAVVSCESFVSPLLAIVCPVLFALVVVVGVM